MKSLLIPGGLVMGLALGLSLTSVPAMASIPGGRVTAPAVAAAAQDVDGMRVARRGADDGPNHDANDDHGRRGRGDDRGRGRGADDGPNHDAGDDHGRRGRSDDRGRGRGADDGPNHDAGDDHGRRGRGDDRGRGRGSDDAQLERAAVGTLIG